MATSERIHEVPVKLDRDELHLLVTWGYAIRGLDAGSFSDPEHALLAKLKPLRDERLVFGVVE